MDQAAIPVRSWRKPSGPVQCARAVRRLQNWPLYLARKLLRKNSFRYRLRTGIEVEVPRGLQRMFREIAIYDVYELDRLLAGIGAEPVVLDIGANAGFFSLFVLERIPHARLYSYEPVPENFVALERNAKLNLPSSVRWRRIESAIVGRPRDSVNLYLPARETVSAVASIHENWRDKAMRKITVPALTLAEIFRRESLGHVDLLKLDCEGAEYEILFETPREFLARIDRIVLETHEIPGVEASPDDVVRFLREQGFEAEQVGALNERVRTIFASRTAD